MKHKLISTLLIATILLGNVVPVYAAEDEKTEIASEDETTAEAEEGLSIDEDGVVSDVYFEEESVFESAGKASEKVKNLPEGDGLEGQLFDVMNIPSSEENNCQVTIKADMPDNFDANIFVQLKNYDTGNIYQYTLYAINSFTERGYIPDGEYRVIECSVYDDINSTFPMNIPEDFTLKYGEVKTLTVDLQDEAAAVEAIAERLHQEAEEGTKDLSEFTVSDFDVTFTGTGSGKMAVTGTQSQAMTIVAKIKEGGLPGDATVDISLDDGMTFNMTDVKIPYSGMVKLSGTGLTLVFETSKKSVLGELKYGVFDAGDTFRCVVHDPTTGVTYGGEYKGNTRLELVDEDPDVSIYDQMTAYNIPKVVVKVIKGGTPGEAVVQYSLDGDTFSDEMIVPESASWPINETSLTLHFYTKVGQIHFNTDDEYTVEPYKENKKSFIGILLAISALFAAGAMAVWYYFKKQIISQGVYQIHEYVPVKTNNSTKNTEDKPRKDKKKKKR